MDKCANACNYFISESESSEDEFHELGIVIKYIRWILRQCWIPCSTYLLQLMKEDILDGCCQIHPNLSTKYIRCMSLLSSICAIFNILKDRRLLKDTKLVSVEEQLVIFLG